MAHAAVTGEAIAGRPFGVARVTLDIPPGDAGPTRGFAIVEAAGRAHYPAYQATGIGEKLGDIAEIGGGILGKDRPLLKLIGRIGAEIPPTVNVFVLFTGDEPLKLTVYTPTANTLTLAPRPLPGGLHDRLLKSWWREYNANVKAQSEAGDYPALVETYLTAMLGRRLGLDPPAAAQKKTSEPQETLELIFGTESSAGQNDARNNGSDGAARVGRVARAGRRGLDAASDSRAGRGDGRRADGLARARGMLLRAVWHVPEFCLDESPHRRVRRRHDPHDQPPRASRRFRPADAKAAFAQGIENRRSCRRRAD